jgi:hypothetical protein
MVEPSVPLGGHERRFREILVHDPSAFAVTGLIVRVTQNIFTHKSPITLGVDPGSQRIAVPPSQKPIEELYHRNL